jgi:hypothetical protein
VPSSLTTIDLRLVEAMLQMGDGYVLDFSDRAFTEFFRDFDVDIDHARYTTDGASKAKRLRRFLRTAEPELVGKALKAFLEYRLALVRGTPPQNDVDAYRSLVERLVGPALAAPEAPAPLALHTLDPELFDTLKLDAPLARLLRERFAEAQACFNVGAHLAAVILAGSVLEGVFLGFGKHHEQRLLAAYFSRDGRRTPPLDSWGLKDWIVTLRKLGWLSPTIEKFSDGLRDFRNYVHPHQQLRAKFAVDRHTASIAMQIVVATAEELSRVEPSPAGQRRG